jgi:hypothetical protein
VALDREARVFFAHPASVVAHFDALAAAVFEDDVDRRRTGVDCVLDELFVDRRRSLDDFSGSDLIDEVGGENSDAGHL